MASCRTVDRLYAALPLRPFRDWLIRTHMDRCPRCQAGLLSREEAKTLLVGPDQVGGTDRLWRRIAGEAVCAGSSARSLPSPAGAVWRWAAAAAMAAAIALTGFWLLREVGRSGPEATLVAAAGRFRIDYVRVGGEPAQTFIYQPQGTDTVFVWASRTP